MDRSEPRDESPAEPVGDESQAGEGVRTELTDADRAVLDFEGSWWLYPGPKDRAITEYLEMSATRYYQAIRRLMDDELALAFAPLTVRRLRKMRRNRLDQLAARVGDNG